MSSDNEITTDLFHLKTYGALCHAEEFFIKGNVAREEDFGESYDADVENAPDYGCGNRVFERKTATEEVLSRYGITTEEYNTICDALEEKLSFGNCGWCV